jgi:hypothetical protein
MSALCAVAGVGLFTPRYASLAALRAGEASPERRAPSGELLDKHSRRRASELTKACADAYQQALTGADIDAVSCGAVFGSALGEAGTTIGLLDQLWRGPGMLSPMRFAASVHNTAAGVVSIGTKNTGFSTALGADFDTPAMALLEAMAFVLTHDLPVIVVCADEAAPENMVKNEQGWDFLCSAVALVPAANAAAQLARIGAPERGVGSWVTPELPLGLARSPVVGLLDVVAALADECVTEVRLDRGRGGGYGLRILRGS